MTVGSIYTSGPIAGVEIESFGLCQTRVAADQATLPLYEHDTIILNAQSFTHLLFGKAGEFSVSRNDLSALKRQKDSYDIDSAFD